MNNVRAKRLRSFLLAGLGVLVVAVFGAIQYAFTLPPLGGEHLAVLGGMQKDSHLLTGWLWNRLLGSPSIHGFPARTLSLTTLAVLLVLIVATLRRRQMGFLAAICSLVLISSPLIIGVLFDPLGGEDVVSLGLIVLMALDVAGLWKARPTTRCVLVAALALQDVWLAPAALAYSLLAGGAYYGMLVRVASLAIAIAFRALVAPSTFPAPPIAVDFTAGPATIIAIGVVLFAVTPLVLFGIRLRAEPIVALTRAPFVRSIALGAAAATMGMFSQTGDASPYWLYGEACLVIGLVGSALLDTARYRGVLTATLLGIFVVQLLLLARFGGSLPAFALSHAAATVAKALPIDAAHTAPICVAVDPSGERHVLADGALFKLSPASTPLRIVSNASDCLASPPGTDLFTIHDMLATDWGPSGLELARSAQIASEARYVLPISNGIVFPRTHADTPTGSGAFGNMIETPLGAVGDFTISPGFSYRFDCVPHGNRLSFAVGGSPYEALAYEISVTNGSGSRPVLSQGLQALPGADAAQAWQLHVISLPATPACRSIVFKVLPKPGLPGTWITFVGAAILSSTRANVESRSLSIAKEHLHGIEGILRQIPTNK